MTKRTPLDVLSKIVVTQNLNFDTEQLKYFFKRNAVWFPKYMESCIRTNFVIISKSDKGFNLSHTASETWDMWNIFLAARLCTLANLMYEQTIKDITDFFEGYFNPPDIILKFKKEIVRRIMKYPKTTVYKIGLLHNTKDIWVNSCIIWNPAVQQFQLAFLDLTFCYAFKDGCNGCPFRLSKNINCHTIAQEICGYPFSKTLSESEKNVEQLKILHCRFLILLLLVLDEIREKDLGTKYK